MERPTPQSFGTTLVITSLWLALAASSALALAGGEADVEGNKGKGEVKPAILALYTVAATTEAYIGVSAFQGLRANTDTYVDRLARDATIEAEQALERAKYRLSALDGDLARATGEAKLGGLKSEVLKATKARNQHLNEVYLPAQKTLANVRPKTIVRMNTLRHMEGLEGYRWGRHWNRFGPALSGSLLLGNAALTGLELVGRRDPGLIPVFTLPIKKLTEEDNSPPPGAGGSAQAD